MFQVIGSEEWTRPENRTYRNVRLAMIAVLVLLTVSVLIEWFETGRRCWQGSISAYYYTPAHGVFVCSVLAIGVCMIVLKGNTPAENALLNIGGLFAPVVALVPTPNPGSCRSVDQTLNENASPNIANNMWALFAAGALALVLSGWLMIDAKRADKRDPIAAEDGGKVARWGTTQTVALIVSSILFGAGILWFWKWDTNFERIAHYAAAVAFFVMIISLVCLNAIGAYRTTDTNKVLKTSVIVIYVVIAFSMLIFVGYGVIGWLADWQYSLLHVEVALIALFILFWITQTKELWRPGLRRTKAGASPAAKVEVADKQAAET